MTGLLVAVLLVGLVCVPVSVLLLRRPRPQSPTQPAPPAPAVAPAAPPPPVALKDGDSILVVDDDPLLRSFMGRGLRRRGLEPILAESEAEALELLPAHPEIRVVLLDLNLAGVSGALLLESIRRRHPMLPVYVMTGLDVESIGGLAQAPGVIQKPFRIDDLLEQISPG